MTWVIIFSVLYSVVFALFLFWFLYERVSNWKKGMREEKTLPYYRSLLRQYLHVFFFFHRKTKPCVCPVCFDFDEDRTHEWNGCICRLCGKCNFSPKEADHLWAGCKCTKCGKTRDKDHEWLRGCCCRKCGKRHNYVTSDEPCGEYVASIERCSICGDRRVTYVTVSYGNCIDCGASVSGPWYPGCLKESDYGGTLCSGCAGNWFR